MEKGGSSESPFFYLNNGSLTTLSSEPLFLVIASQEHEYNYQCTVRRLPALSCIHSPSLCYGLD